VSIVGGVTLTATASAMLYLRRAQGGWMESGGQFLVFGAIEDGQVLKRVGAAIVGVTLY